MTYGRCDRPVVVAAIGLILLYGADGFAQEPVGPDTRSGTTSSDMGRPLLPTGFARVIESAGAFNVSRAVAATLERWAQAWSNKDVESYFSFYDAQFSPLAGELRADWEQQRRERTQKPEQFSIELNDFDVALRGDTEALVELIQVYRSSSHEERVLKEFVLSRTDGQWRIRSERTLQVIRPESEQGATQSGAAPGSYSSFSMDRFRGDEFLESQQEISGTPLSLTGFWDIRFGIRTQHDPDEKRFTLGETRLHLEFEKDWNGVTGNFVSDVLADAVSDPYVPDLEDGGGVFDLRELNLASAPIDTLDVTVGRQPLTWGTGDLIFINDLFPKDWISFLLGRDVAYLKAPSDAIKISWFHDFVNFDLAYTPRFDADRFIDGNRLSFFNAGVGDRTGRHDKVRTDQPDRWFKDDELALRLFRNIKGYELAAYAYRGFWKSPAGVDPVTGKAIFPDLSVYGASIRGVVANGIANVEVGYYDSRDDEDGDDPLVRNSEARVLVGYEHEIAKEVTGALQYYLEHIENYGDYRKALFPGVTPADENRHLVTLRLTKFMMNQNLILSLFTFYSPSDKDAYLRPKVHYKVNDFWAWEAGANIFSGKEQHTFFGQFEKNTNIYMSTRYSF